MFKFSSLFYLVTFGGAGMYFLSQKVDLRGFEANDYVKIADPFWWAELFRGEKLFTKEELSEYNGVKRTELYLAILGKVYDVSTGRKYYGPGETYHGFVAKDGSKAFSTGDFSPSGFNDRVHELPTGELKGIQSWIELYEKNYIYKGKLIGKFYNSNGFPTEYLLTVLERIKETDDAEQRMKELDRKYPPCNLEWNAEHGKIVWCSKRSGGIERDWAGVPRKFFLPDRQHYRCACVPVDSIPKVNEDGSFLEYIDCKPTADKCYLRQDDESS